MEIVAVVAIVIAITFVVLACFMIPAMIELRRTALDVRKYVKEVDSEFQPVLKELHELALNLRVITHGIASKTGEIEGFMTAVGDTGRNISRINVVAGAVADLVGRSSFWMTGVKAASRYLIDRISKKGR